MKSSHQPRHSVQAMRSSSVCSGGICLRRWWQRHVARPKTPFFSRFCCQKLFFANGNLVVDVWNVMHNRNALEAIFFFIFANVHKQHFWCSESRIPYQCADANTHRVLCAHVLWSSWRKTWAWWGTVWSAQWECRTLQLSHCVFCSSLSCRHQNYMNLCFHENPEGNCQVHGINLNFPTPHENNKKLCQSYQPLLYL